MHMMTHEEIVKAVNQRQQLMAISLCINIPNYSNTCSVQIKKPFICDLIICLGMPVKSNTNISIPYMMKCTHDTR